MEMNKDNLRMQWDTNAMAIKNSPYFQHLSLMELNECSVVSSIISFRNNERVLGE